MTDKASEHRNPVVVLLAAAICVTVAIIAGLIIYNATKSKDHEAAPTQQTSEQTETEVALPTDPQGLLDVGAREQPAEKVANEKQRKAMLAEARRDPQDGRALGKADAPVVMVEFGDFSCPMCERAQEESISKLTPLIDAGVLRVEWKDMAFFGQYHSEYAAAGGLAAANRGKFWPFHDAAYKLSADGDHPDWNEDLLRQTAQKAGIEDVEDFIEEAGSDELASQVDQQTDHASTDLGLQGTPMFFINDRFISGAQDPQLFLATIRAAYKDATGRTNIK